MLVSQTLSPYLSYDVLFIIILKIKKKFGFLEGGGSILFSTKTWDVLLYFHDIYHGNIIVGARFWSKKVSEPPPPTKNRKKSNFFQRKLVRVFPEKIPTFSKFHNFLTRRSTALRKIYVIAMV